MATVLFLLLGLFGLIALVYYRQQITKLLRLQELKDVNL